MQVGVVYPQTELPVDPATVRAYVRAVADLGYHHVLAYDHVLGADPVAYPGWTGPYDISSTFHEPLVLFGFVAGFSTLELVTGVIIAPQHQTVLLAKQATEVDILAGGRFRLGIGIGWNRVEYEGLGQEFATRGQREEEQVALLRRLWTERSVTHRGRFDKVTGAGIAPLPAQRPIPIWLGGQSSPAYRRIGRLADGWFPQVQPGPMLDHARQLVAGAAESAGRDPSALGMEGRVSLGTGGPQAAAGQVRSWQEAGATHVAVNTMGAGLLGLDEHLKALSLVAAALGLSRGE
ncbi:MAG: LLM class F420-dependent oxidoreductase [Acidimicrobiales bacterium]